MMSTTLNPYFYAYTPELLAFENAWVNFVKNNEINRTIIRPEIADSWQRCKDLGIDPLTSTSLKNAGNADDAGQTHFDIIDIVNPFLKMLKDAVEPTGFGILFCGPDGTVLEILYPHVNEQIYNKLNITRGCLFSEEAAGTNAIGLSLKLKKPIQISGAENYLQTLQKFSMSAAPIINNDELFGTLALIGRCEQVHKHTLGIVIATSEAIRNKMQILEINKKLIVNNDQLSAALNIITDGLVYVNDGKIVQVNNEMCNFLGKSREELIGKNPETEIITTPELFELLNSGYSKHMEHEIILKGRNRNYQCIFELRKLNEDNGINDSKIMTFTRTEEIKQLASKIKYSAKYTFDDIIGQSKSMVECINLAKKASEYDTRVLIEGESGTGKEMLAQAIHNNSKRKDGPFIAINCATMPKDLFESQFFGYEHGAFTGAKKEGHIGLFELANRGTLFLDEIGDMPLEIQIKFLRVLQDGEFVRVGGNRPIKTDVRIIAATNVNLKEEVEKGNFRHDLYYRLNVFYIQTPSLRQRKEDIPLLIQHFIDNYSSSIVSASIDKKASEALQNYHWPGNVRQLYNTVERALIMSRNGHITLQDLPVDVAGFNMGLDNFSMTDFQTLDEVISEYIKHIVTNCNNNVSKAADLLNVSRATVYKYLKKE
jgi:transcriptional regulator with PAS, ATPase and Fis domain